MTSSTTIPTPPPWPATSSALHPQRPHHHHHEVQARHQTSQPAPSGGKSASYPSPPAPDAITLRPPPPPPPSPDTLALLAELPDDAGEDLVPLGEVVDVVLRDIYGRLAQLGDTLPGLHESARAPHVFQFALYAKRQAVKLLALVRWSKESEAVERCMVRARASARSQNALPTARADDPLNSRM